MENRQWYGATYGTGWMHRTLIRSLRFLDVRLFYWFSYIFVIPVALIKNPSSMFTKTGTRMISIKEDMSHLFEIDRALVGGDIVSFPSDRYMGDARTIECEFFSRKAKFPMGPFSVATMRGLNVLAINVMKEGAKKYHIYITELPYDKSASRKQQLTSLLSAYVAELERILRKYPSQWYNFYDFWNVAGTDGVGESKGNGDV